jgi:electron transfer flavoprotein-quinone oxidoreductase
MEEFRLHPSVAPLLEGGELVEYGAHLIPEAGLKIVPQLSGDGWLVAGDAAGFVYSNGLVIHGMNYAIRSGIIAGEAALHAKTANDFSAASLASYDARIKESYIWKDFKRFKKMHSFVWDQNVHHAIPGLVEGVFKDLFTANMEPKKKTRDIVRKEIKKQGVGVASLAKTALKGAGSI